MFEDDDVLLVINAVKAFIATDDKGYPPVIGVIKKKMRDICQLDIMTELEAWNYIKNSPLDTGAVYYAKIRNLNSSKVEQLEKNEKKSLLYYLLNNKRKCNFEFSMFSQFSATFMNKIYGMFSAKDIRETAVDSLLSKKTGTCHDVALAVDWALEQEGKTNRHLVGFTIACS